MAWKRRIGWVLLLALAACGRGAPGGTLPTADPTAPAATADPTRPPTVVEHGFGQDGATVAYGFLLHNPNEATALENVPYEVVVTDSEGEFLGSDSGRVAVLLPGQTLGQAAAITVFEGDTVGAIDVRLGQGTPSSGDAGGAFTVTSPHYFPREQSAIGTGIFANLGSGLVTGLLTSSLAAPAQDVRVSAITRDAAGGINGGGNTYVGFLAPGDAAGVAVYVNASGDVAAVELHPEHPPLARAPLPQPAAPLELLDFGFGPTDFDAGYALIIRNPNEQAVELSRYRVTAYDADGRVVGTDESYIDLLLPGQTLGVGGALIPQAQRPAVRLEARLLDGRPGDPGDMQPLTTSDAAFVDDDIFPHVTGLAHNPNATPFVNVRVSAVAYDDTGRIIGGGLAFVDVVPANGSAPAAVPITTSAAPARVELFAATSVLSGE